MFGADLVVNESAVHAGAIILLKVNFQTFVLLYSTYSLYSVFLALSDLVGAKNLSDLKSSILLIILDALIKSPLNLLYFKVDKSSSFPLSV